MKPGTVLREVPPAAKRAVGVIRVSRQDEDAVSPDEQRQRIEQACEREGLALTGIYREPNVSGGADLERRPGLRPAVEMVEEQRADVIVVAYFDRLVRSLKVQAEILERVERAGGKVLAVDVGAVSADTAATWLTSTLMGAVNEYARRMTAERTEQAKRLAVERGAAPFALPFYLRSDERDGGVIVHRTREVRLLREAINMRIQGATIKACREHLRKRGVKVSYRGVQLAFASKLLLGELHFGKHVNEHAFPPVIDPETFRRLQKVSVPRGRRPKSDRLLARLGILRCGTCGSAMQTGTSKTHYALYKCPYTVDCERKAAISATKAEKILSDYTRERLEGLKGAASMGDELDAAERELERAMDARDNVVESLEGMEDVASVRAKLRELNERVDAARERADHLRVASVPVIHLSAHRDWDLLTLDERRSLIRAVVAMAIVRPGRGDDRITITPVS
jgi:site-specific DNA recombinase